MRRRRKRGENGGAWGGAGERERGDETTRRPRDASRREAIETVYDQCGRARLTLSGVRSCAHLFGQELCAAGEAATGSHELAKR